MGLYFRKSIKLGPIRLNFSKSGVSYSVGPKGAKINFSQRGTYVNFGSHGLYYRKKISSPSLHQKKTPIPLNTFAKNIDQKLTNAIPIDTLTDTVSQEFINELTNKNQKTSFLKTFAFWPLILVFVCFWTIFLSPRYNSPIPEIFVRSSSKKIVNVTSFIEGKNIVLGTIKNSNEGFELLDDSNKDLYKIRFNNSTGFVSKKNTKTFRKKLTLEERKKYSTTYYQEYTLLHWILFTLIITAYIVFLIFLKQWDSKRLYVKVYYTFDKEIKEVHEKFIRLFSTLLDCHCVWQYLSIEKVGHYKYSNKERKSVDRSLIRNISINKYPLIFFKTNIQIPFLGLEGLELYFFPELLILKKRKVFAGIMYKNLNCKSEEKNFIESDGVPKDAKIVDYTWKYLNKDNSPDQRFKDNPKLPVCKYSKYTFSSESGLNIIITTSQLGAMDGFVEYINKITQIEGELKSKREE